MSEVKPGKKLYFKKEKKSLKPKRHKAPSSKPKVIFSAKDVEKQGKKKLELSQFPRISRFIPEGSVILRKFLGKFTGKKLRVASILPHIISPLGPLKKKNVWLAGVFVCTIVFALFLSWELWQTWTTWRQTKMEYAHLQQELRTWEDVTSRYPTYRDAYFEAAVLAYRLGDRQKELLYLQKVLAIDPNFVPAQQLKNFAK